VNRAAVAAHEAGHLVAGELLGQRAESVVVLGEHGGETRGTAAADQDPQDRMVVLLAGRAAQVAFGYPVSPIDTNGDQLEARRIVQRLTKLGDSATADWLYRHAEERAEQLVRDQRDAIASVARDLVANGGRLGGREVSTALKRALGKARHARILPRGNSAGPDEIDAALAQLRRGRSAGWRDAGLRSRHPSPGRGRPGHAEEAGHAPRWPLVANRPRPGGPSLDGGGRA